MQLIKKILKKLPLSQSPEKHEYGNGQRLELEEKLRALEVALDNLNGERNHWKWKAESLQREVDYAAQIRTEARLFEFDYSYRPQVRKWNCLPNGNSYQNLISLRDETYSTWTAAFARHARRFFSILRDGSPDHSSPYWSNGWFPPLDGICLYGLIAETKPKIYMEVGSGNSTKFARRAISDHGLNTRIISIDPYPRAVIDDLCDEVIRTPLEQVDPNRFPELQSGDMLFIDNSHRSFQGSDVTVFFTEVLPSLRSCVLWGVHDIFLPRDYPEIWLSRMYNEQYLLMAYLLGGAGGDRIELPVAYLDQNPALLADLVAAAGPVPPWRDIPLVGGAFWMRKA